MSIQNNQSNWPFPPPLVIGEDEDLRQRLSICYALIGSMQETIRNYTYKEVFFRGYVDRLKKENRELRERLK